MTYVHKGGIFQTQTCMCGFVIHCQSVSLACVSVSEIFGSVMDPVRLNFVLSSPPISSYSDPPKPVVIRNREIRSKCLNRATTFTWTDLRRTVFPTSPSWPNILITSATPPFPSGSPDCHSKSNYPTTN